MRGSQGQVRPGGIHILPECPPLHGDELKDRPVVVISAYPEDGIVVVAVSTKVSLSVQDRVRLPDRSTQPQTKSGLWEPCWAVPEWYLVVRVEELGRKIGYIGGVSLRKIVKAVQVHVAVGDPPVTRRARS